MIINGKSRVTLFCSKINYIDSESTKIIGTLIVNFHAYSKHAKHIIFAVMPKKLLKHKCLFKFR